MQRCTFLGWAPVLPQCVHKGCACESCTCQATHTTPHGS